jgi:predicted outer membrane repeat protein
MSSGAVSGNTASFGGGVYVTGTFSMSGGVVDSNTSGGGVSVHSGGTFKMSGDTQPERVFLSGTSQSIILSGPLLGSGLTSVGLSVPFISRENAPVLTLDASYALGNLADLKTYFTLKSAITGYEISDTGLFVASGN